MLFVVAIFFNVVTSLPETSEFPQYHAFDCTSSDWCCNKVFEKWSTSTEVDSKTHLVESNWVNLDNQIQFNCIDRRHVIPEGEVRVSQAGPWVLKCPSSTEYLFSYDTECRATTDTCSKLECVESHPSAKAMIENNCSIQSSKHRQTIKVGLDMCTPKFRFEVPLIQAKDFYYVAWVTAEHSSWTYVDVPSLGVAEIDSPNIKQQKIKWGKHYVELTDVTAGLEYQACADPGYGSARILHTAMVSKSCRHSYR